MTTPGARIEPIALDEEGRVEALLGNEAIVRGALEAGVAFASGYPGTPSSEVTDTFARIGPSLGIGFEYAVNEKIALELAFAASLAGARAIVAMKHLGLMYAGDPLSTIPYIGTVAGLVIVSAGDPSCLTSPNEQDQRYLGPMLHIPVLDPSTPREAYAMARFAFGLSERSRLPVILRPTTRVCHTRAPIRFGTLEARHPVGFERDPRRFIPMPENARRMRREIEGRLATATALLESTDFVRRIGDGRSAILASGAPAAACEDLLREQGLLDRIALVTAGVAFPLPERRLLELLRDVERVLVVEELSPYLEDALRALFSLHGRRIEVLGKRTGHLPVEFEYDPELIERAVRRAFDLGPRAVAAPTLTVLPDVPPRPPTLCPGCPHRATYFAARSAFGDEELCFNDIGCYTLGAGPPLDTVDALLSMGAAFTLAAGVSRVTGKRTVGFLGDGTFFHSGMPALLDAIQRDDDIIAVILDNQVTAMTGFQESPGITIEKGVIARKVPIEGIVRALGAKHVETIDPNDLPRAIAAFRRAQDAKGVSVVIAERTCPVFLARRVAEADSDFVWEIAPDACQTCGRERHGMRCEQCTTHGYERHMARARSLEESKDPAARTDVAPCSAECPLGLCVQGYVGHVAAGELPEAFGLIMAHTPLPEAVCRVCDRPCESVCPRAALDEPIAINDLKRFVIGRSDPASYVPKVDPPHGKRVAVVGAGPSGLAAAHDLSVRGYEVTLFDAAARAGGMLEQAIPPYRMPREAVRRDTDRILAMGVRFVGGAILGRGLALGDLLAQGYDAVYLAVGAHRGLRLDVPSEPGEGVPAMVDALTYLKAAHGGREPYTGAHVVVVGGGNTAVDAARTARRRGAVRVTLVFPEGRADMPAYAEEIAGGEAEGLELREGWAPAQLARGGLLCAPSGKVAWLPLDAPPQLFEADQIIVAIGQTPEPALFGPGDPELERAPDGSLVVDGTTTRTSHPRVFAGGDLVRGPRTVTRAIAWGKRAAWGIDVALRGAEEADRRQPPPRHQLSRASAPPRPRADHVPRQRAAELSAETRTGHFEEITGALTDAQAQAEAARCLACGLCGNCRACLDLFGCPAFFLSEGRPKIDPGLCIGCGVCGDLCPNDAIRKVPRHPVIEEGTLS